MDGLRGCMFAYYYVTLQGRWILTPVKESHGHVHIWICT